MTVDEALEIAGYTLNECYRHGIVDPAVEREGALNVLAEEVGRLRAEVENYGERAANHELTLFSIGKAVGSEWLDARLISVVKRKVANFAALQAVVRERERTAYEQGWEDLRNGIFGELDRRYPRETEEPTNG